MTVRELLSQVRDKLQDTDAAYWDDSELINHFNECKRYLAAERKDSPTTITIDLTDDVYEYETEGILRYVSIKDSEGKTRPLYADDTTGDDIAEAVIVQDYNRIYVNSPKTGVSLNVKHIAFPVEDNLNDVIRSGDEESFRYFIIGKAYEKDNDMENFQKAQYFNSMFLKAIDFTKKNNSLNYINKTQTIKSYFY